MTTTFSLVIPVAPYRNAEVLESLKHMDYPSEYYEIIVEKGRSASANRNEGVKKAIFDYIVFLDDDAVVPSDLLRNAHRFLSLHPEADVLGGPQLTPPDDGYFAKTSGYILASYFGSQNMRFRYIQGKETLNADESYLTTAICCVRRSLFSEVGYFDESLFPGEDPEFFARVKEAGKILTYIPDLYVYHRRRATFKPYVKQIYLYGKVRLQKEKIRNTIVHPLYLIPSLFFLYLVLLVPLSFVSFYFIYPLFLYLLFACVSSLLIVIEYGNYFSFPVLVFLYFVHHLSYGAGLLQGLFGLFFK